MRRRASCLALIVFAGMSSGSLWSQNEVEAALQEARRRLQTGTDSPQLAAARARWQEYEQAIMRALPRQDQAVAQGGLQLDQAISKYETLADLRATPVNHYLAGRMLGIAGQLDQARVHFDRAITMDPYFYWAHHGLGTYFAMREMPEPASKHFRRALELNPDFVKASRGLALCHVGMGRMEQAEIAFRTIVGKNPNDVETWWSLGQMLVRTARYADAIEIYQTVARLAPNRKGLKSALGLCYSRTDQVDKAIQLFEDMLRVNPSDAMASLELGKIHQRLGHNHKAADYLERALENLPLQAAIDRSRVEEAIVTLRSLPENTTVDPNRKTPQEWVQLLLNSLEVERRREAIRILSRSPFRHPDIDSGI